MKTKSTKSDSISQIKLKDGRKLEIKLEDHRKTGGAISCRAVDPKSDKLWVGFAEIQFLSKMFEEANENDVEVGCTISNESFRGTGLSYFLICTVAQWALKNGFDSILAQTESDNKPALKISSNCGFEKTEYYRGITLVNNDNKTTGKEVSLKVDTKKLVKLSKEMWEKKDLKVL